MEIKTIFLIFGIAAAVYAVVITFVGLRANNFPSSRGALAGLIALGVVLVVGTGVYAVKLSTLEAHEREAGQQVIGDEASTAPIRIPSGLA